MVERYIDPERLREMEEAKQFPTGPLELGGVTEQPFTWHDLLTLFEPRATEAGREDIEKRLKEGTKEFKEYVKEPAGEEGEAMKWLGHMTSPGGFLSIPGVADIGSAIWDIIDLPGLDIKDIPRLAGKALGPEALTAWLKFMVRPEARHLWGPRAIKYWDELVQEAKHLSPRTARYTERAGEGRFGVPLWGGRRATTGEIAEQGGRELGLSAQIFYKPEFDYRDWWAWSKGYKTGKTRLANLATVIHEEVHAAFRKGDPALDALAQQVHRIIGEKDLKRAFSHVPKYTKDTSQELAEEVVARAYASALTGSRSTVHISRIMDDPTFTAALQYAAKNPDAGVWELQRKFPKLFPADYKYMPTKTARRTIVDQRTELSKAYTEEEIRRMRREEVRKTTAKPAGGAKKITSQEKGTRVMEAPTELTPAQRETGTWIRVGDKYVNFMDDPRMWPASVEPDARDTLLRLRAQELYRRKTK